MYTPSELRAAELISVAPQKIYSTHAGERNVFQLPKLLIMLDAILVDLRFAPPILPLKLNKDYLKLLLKNKYWHLPLLGDRMAGRGKPAIQNLSAGLKIITNLKANVLLFCACEIEEHCHRHIIVRELIKQNKEVVEISNWEKSE